MQINDVVSANILLILALVKILSFVIFLIVSRIVNPLAFEIYHYPGEADV
jgi:hypothetical protein